MRLLSTVALLPLLLAGACASSAEEAQDESPPSERTKMSGPVPALPDDIAAIVEEYDASLLYSCAEIRAGQYAEEEMDQVVVTGSRILSAPMSSPAPAVSMEAMPSPSYAPTPPPGPGLPPMADTSRFDNGEQNTVQRTIDNPVSTFSADVDTSAYAVGRRYLRDCELPPSESVRIEEYINAFDYDYERPRSADRPFRPDVSVMPSPWNEDAELLRIGIEGYDLDPEETPDANIVLLLDVSGSMSSRDKLPLLKEGMKMLVGELDADDRVSIVVYAGAAGAVLEPTPGNRQDEIMAALDRLQAGGSTAGGAGLALAYELAERNFDPDAVNRIILATDGDFNVGVTGDDPLTDFVARKRDAGIYLSVLGFGRGNLNDQLMQAIAQNGNGTAAYIDSAREAERVLVREFTSSIFPIAEDVKFQVEFNPAVVSEYRLIGYQTRLLDEEDFDNDAVDAGEVGSGATVTALYEIVRRGTEGWLPERRYEARALPAEPAYDADGEIAFLRMRYKLPGTDESLLIERPITPRDRESRFARASDDDRFAVLVSAFAEKMARSDYVDDGYTYADIYDAAREARGEDPYGDRAIFIAMVRRAMELELEARSRSDG